MAIEVVMPQLSDTMSEGTILTWLKKEGEQVSRGDALAEVATDKADLEIESFHDGVLAKISAPNGSKVKVGSVIAVINESGASVAPQQAAPQNSRPAEASPAAAAPQPTPPAPTPAPSPSAQPQSHQNNNDGGERVKISPLARNVAQSHGVDVTTLQGSGEGGRIVRRDVEGALANQVAAPVATKAPSVTRPASAPAASMAGKSAPLSRMRTVIAQRMVESTTTIPHFYCTSKIMMDAVKRLKDSLKTLPQYEGITYNHIILKASALALRAFPAINASYREGSLIQPSDVNIGIVTAVEGGLLIPVLKRVDQLPLADIVAEARGLVQRARTGRPKQDDLVDGTFSISNMGMFAVESFTAIISPGQGAILAISAIDDEPVAMSDQVAVAAVMRATLSVDHRVIDGVMAGEFLTELKRLLEDPVLLLA